MKKTEAARPPLPDAKGKRFAIVSARFYAKLADWLEDGARRGLRDCGVAESDVTLFTVPGCFEIPLVARKLAVSGRYDALIALGAVIRGDTPHFDYVAGECAAGIAQVALESGVPVAFGVLTTDTVEQATARAGGKDGNKGAAAALTAIEMANLLRRLDR